MTQEESASPYSSHHSCGSGSCLPSDAQPLQQVDIHPSWFSSPEFLKAQELSGWPNCSEPDFWTAFADVLDAVDAAMEVLEPELERRGLGLGEALDLISQGRAGANDPTARGGIGTEARKAVRRFWLAEFSPDQIASILDLPVEAIQAYLSQAMPGQARQVIALHLEGKTPLQISRLLSLSRGTVYRHLVESGMEPHRKNGKVPASTRQAIVDAYRRGASYVEIERLHGVDKTTITNTLRAAKKRGECPEYGTRSFS